MIYAVIEIYTSLPNEKRYIDLQKVYTNYDTGSIDSGAAKTMPLKISSREKQGQVNYQSRTVSESLYLTMYTFASE